MELFDKTTFEISRLITNRYSTSFSFATSLMNREHREAIYAIYGFVRLADEIVDTFHNFDKESLLDRLEEDLALALEQKISTNPILHSFQFTVNKYGIPRSYIDAFLASMRADLKKTDYRSKTETDRYIYGSADVVGLMCLKIFTDNDEALFRELEAPAMRLGSAFQKVNFLRDLRSDAEELGRVYFHNVNYNNFNEEEKGRIVDEIEADFDAAWKGIAKLPADAKIAVSVAYYYYRNLLEKLKQTPAKEIKNKRIRTSNLSKMMIIAKTVTLGKLKLI